MSKTESFLIRDAQNAAPTRDTGKKAAMLHPQNVVRRKLADISNLPQNQRLLIQEKAQCIETTTTKEYIEQLQKENMALVKMLAQRNKIIEQSGIELDRLRLHILKMQEQNQQLALSNTKMIAELNSGKDRLKLLQHELECKGGVIKALRLELEGATKPCKNAVTEMLKSREEEESFKEGIDDEKPHRNKRILESNGLGPSEQDESKEKIQNKRRYSRRQSARFKATEVVPAEDLFETSNGTEVSISQLPDDKEETKNKSDRPLVRRQSVRCKAEVKTAEDTFEANSTDVSTSQLPDDKEHKETKRPFARRQSARFKAAEVKPDEVSTETNGTKDCESRLPDDTAREQGSTSECVIEKNESEIVCLVPKYEPQEFRRTSLSRPSRVAAKKVQSYKEIPLNAKMRRT